MACRIGITTDPDRRKQEWENEYPNLYGWEILQTCATKSKAQEAENSLALQHGCESAPGGDGEENDQWHVYKFNYS